jgi:hypothetical protein
MNTNVDVEPDSHDDGDREWMLALLAADCIPPGRYRVIAEIEILDDGLGTPQVAGVPGGVRFSGELLAPLGPVLITPSTGAPPSTHRGSKHTPAAS